jgi:hypothetical protein
MNAIILTIPYRHNIKGSNITFNNEIISFNRRLHKLKKIFLHLTVIVKNENRHLSHGLCLNNLGKEMLSINLVLKSFSLTEEKNDPSTNIRELKFHEVQP